MHKIQNWSPKFLLDSIDIKWLGQLSIQVSEHILSTSHWSHHRSVTKNGPLSAQLGLPPCEQQWVTTEKPEDCQEPCFTFLTSTEPSKTGKQEKEKSWHRQGHGTRNQLHTDALDHVSFSPEVHLTEARAKLNAYSIPVKSIFKV